MSSPLLDYLNRARQVAPGGMGQMAGGFADLLKGMRFKNRPDGLTKPNRRAQAQPAPQGTSPFMNYLNRPQGQQPTQPAMVRQSGPGQNGYGISYAPSAPEYGAGSTGPGDSPDVGVEGISTNPVAEAIHTGLMAALPNPLSAVTAAGKGINFTGLNQLSMMGVEPQLSTNHAGNDVASHQDSVAVGMVGHDAINNAAAAVADGSSSGSQSGPSGVGADGSGGNMGDPSGEGGGGTYRKGGYIKPDRDKKLEARKVTAHEGEFVIRPEAVSDIGLELLRLLNARK
jgi:hypothetical protein